MDASQQDGRRFARIRTWLAERPRKRAIREFRRMSDLQAWARKTTLSGKDQRKLDKSEHVVMKYFMERDDRQCGQCGATLTYRAATVRDVVPADVGAFRVEDGEAITGGPNEAIRSSIDAAQLGCTRHGQTLDKMLVMWRSPNLRRPLVSLPVARIAGGGFLWVPEPQEPA